jgi:hypothetical protein
LGGGGNSTQGSVGSPGTDNTGGGGGGGSDSNVAGGNGGSGIVIVSYVLSISSSVEEATILNSQDGTGELEKGIQTFGDGSGRTVIDGKTIRFNIGGVEKVQIDASGNVGIGMSPSYKFDVNGDVNIASGSHYKVNGSNLTYSDVGAQVVGSYLTSPISTSTATNGTGFLKGNGSVISFDTSTYLTSYTETDPVWIADKPDYVNQELAIAFATAL